MEIVIGLLVVAALAFYLIRKNKEVETELQATEAQKAESPVVDVAPVVEDVKVEAPVVEEKQWPMVETAPKAKPRRQRKPVEKTVAKPAAKPAKKPAAIQAASKAKKPRTPKAK